MTTQDYETIEMHVTSKGIHAAPAWRMTDTLDDAKNDAKILMSFPTLKIISPETHP